MGNTRELNQPRRRRQRERQKSNTVKLANNNFFASRFFVYFLAVVARLQRENA